MESTYENRLFASVKSSIDARVDANDTPDSVVVKAMDVCHSLMSNRASTFTGDLGPEATIFHSSAVDLMTTQGACGSYSQVLARTLKLYNLPVRIAQMKANGIYGAHNIVEVKTGADWIVLDPTFNLAFVRPDNRLASFSDVQHDWKYYSRQVPAGYDPAYHYEDVRYTNWTKIPVILPLAKKLLTVTIGPEKANSFSIRTFFMNTYAVYVFIGLILYIPLLFFTIKRLIQKKVFQDQQIPLTYRNLVKHLRPRFAATFYSH